MRKTNSFRISSSHRRAERKKKGKKAVPGDSQENQGGQNHHKVGGGGRRGKKKVIETIHQPIRPSIVLRILARRLTVRRCGENREFFLKRKKPKKRKKIARMGGRERRV